MSRKKVDTKIYCDRLKATVFNSECIARYTNDTAKKMKGSPCYRCRAGERRRDDLGDSFFAKEKIT